MNYFRFWKPIYTINLCNVGQDLVKNFYIETCRYCSDAVYLKNNICGYEVSPEISFGVVYDILGNEIARIQCHSENCIEINQNGLKGLYYIRLCNKNNEVVKTISRYFE